MPRPMLPADRAAEEAEQSLHGMPPLRSSGCSIQSSPPAHAFCRVLVDDLIIWADSPAEMLSRTRTVLSLFCDNGLRLRIEGYRFDKATVNLFGHVISTDGVSIDSASRKLQGIIDYPMPATKHDVRAFLGLTWYYRELIPQYARKALALANAAKDDAPDVFGALTGDCLAAFRSIQAAFGEVVAKPV